MTDTNRETLRTTFGQDAELYDQCRPAYPPQLFTDLATLADLGPRSAFPPEERDQLAGRVAVQGDAPAAAPINGKPLTATAS